MALLSLLLLLAGFASQGGRATVTYQPTHIERGGQGCPSDEKKVQAIENIYNLIEDKVEIESTPEGRLLTELNTAVETLEQEVAGLSNTTQTVNETLTEEVVNLSNTSQTVNETLTELRQEVSDLSIASQTVNAIVDDLITLNAAASCSELFENRPDLPPGYYWIRSSNGTAVNLYCDIVRQCCNETTEGWARIAYLDMMDPNQQCPPNWQEITTSGVRACARTPTSTASCDSVIYPTNGTSYSRVCGKVIGYQYCAPDAFNSAGPTPIESFYVDGVSITHSTPRQHVWTFAAGWFEGDTSFGRCPCISNPNDANLLALSVGDDFFCDTGATISRSNCPDISADLLIDHPLWDGGECGPTGGCCVNNNPPWFCKTLSQPTTDDIEVRICTDQGTNDENIVIEIYVN